MISINFSGDILPGSLPYYIGINYPRYFNSPFDKCKFNKDLTEVFNQGDFNFINLESPLLKDLNISTQEPFAGGKYFIDFLKEYNIKFVSLANNHMHEHGDLGIDNTIELLDEYNVTYTGILNNKGYKLAVINKNDLRIGVLSFSNVQVKQPNNRIPKLVESNITQIMLLFEKNNIGFKIIIIHWGDEYIHSPSTKQIQLARELIDNGINVIIGHHPHVIQPIEKYKNGLIFYSLGNCIFGNLFSQKVKMGIIAQLKIKNRKDYDYKIFPIYLNYKDGFSISQNPRIQAAGEHPGGGAGGRQAR